MFSSVVAFFGYGGRRVDVALLAKRLKGFLDLVNGGVVGPLRMETVLGGN